MKIDWNEAPKWAIGHGIVIASSVIKEVWFGDEAFMYVGDSRSYIYGGGTGETRHSITCSEIRVSELRPAVWTGEGLPPVGTVCELSERVLLADSDTSDWFEAGTKVEIGGHATFNGATGPVCAVCVVDENFTGTLSEVCLRPIRTHEQIAAEERLKAIDEMAAVYRSNFEGHVKDGCKALYDAGYRKQVKS